MDNKKFATDQEGFWAGEFGDEYINRNKTDSLLASNINFFSKSLARTDQIKSCIEFGANIGMNLRAIKMLYPKIHLNAIEINKTASQQLTSFIDKKSVFTGSIFNYEISQKFELVLIKGVLIHINPNKLDEVYKKLYESSSRYILIAEYFNPSPVEVNYRGHTDRLFKRDFAGDILDKYPEIKLLDYGFSYHRDSHFPQDNITWFLLKK